MAFDTVALLAGIVIFIVILAVILFLVFNNHTVAGNRIQLIRAYKTAPRKVADAPVLVHGPADSAKAVLLTTGEPVAFYAAFIMSGDCTLIRNPDDRQLLPSASSFRVFITSGDFSITEAGVTYSVSIVSALDRFRKGAAMFTENQ